LFGWILLLYTAGLYAPERVMGGEPIFERLAIVSVLAIGLTVLLYYLAGEPMISPKTVLAIYGFMAFLLLWGWRVLVVSISVHLLRPTGVAFVNCGPAASELLTEIRAKKGLGYDARLAFDTHEVDTISSIQVPDIESFLKETIARDIGLIVVGDSHDLGDDWKKALFGLLGKPISFKNVPDFFELVVRRVPVGYIDALWFLENIDLRSKRVYQPIKRILDIFVSILGMALTIPFWPFIALAIKLSSPGEIFFLQQRLGKGGKVFTIRKFRTMRTNGNSYIPTAKGDSRITTVGRFLRASRLDELPQLLNVVKGDMSFVGPRPERPELAFELAKAIPFYNQRHLIKPGLTGWDQVSGEYHSPSVEDTYKKLQYDLYYVKNLSALMDASIFFKTILTVVQRAGL
jgi:exopolysaccharide biosynthesis polyprenyl glycosylphosphotransferase